MAILNLPHVPHINFILQLEKDELEEFELLEMAAEDCSFSSQCSLVAGIVNKSDPLTSSPEIPQPAVEGPQSLLENGALSLAGANKPVDLIHQSDESRGLSHDFGDATTKHPPSNYAARSEIAPTSSPRYSTTEEDSDCSLDETLKPSLAAGVVFSDEEAWESFTHGSPAAHAGQRTVLNGAATPERGTSWASPVKREQLDQWGRTVFSSALPASSLHHHNPSPENVHMKELPAVSPPLPAVAMQKFDNHPQSSDPVPMSTLASLPPPSALVSKLFPALRREREESGKQGLSQMVTTSRSTPTSNPVLMQEDRSPSVPSPVVQVPMNEELKQKLCQLEIEIERFRGENAALERLKREKEEVSINLLS